MEKESVLETIAQLSPFFTLLPFLINRSINACRLGQQKPTARFPVTSDHRRLLRILIICLILSILVFGFCSSTLDDEIVSNPPEYLRFYTLASVFAWSVICLANIQEWFEYYGPASASILTYVVLLPMQSQTLSSIQKVASLVSVFIVFTVFSIAGFEAVRGRQNQLGASAQDPLLPTTGNHKSPGYGTANSSDDTGISSSSPVSSEFDFDDDDSEDGFFSSRNKIMKEEQEKAFEAAGDWYTYLARFTIFMPLVIPRNNVRIQLYLVLALIVLICERVLNLLIPRQLGIITTKLAHAYPYTNSDGDRPALSEIQTDVGIWFIMYFLNSRGGLSFVQELLKTPIEQFSYKAITAATLKHFMALSADFHDDESSAELIKAVEQGRALTHLMDLVIFDLIPECIDVCVGCWYFYTIFGIEAAFGLAATVAGYFWITIVCQRWYNPFRRDYVKSGRDEYQARFRPLSDWRTVASLNRTQYEQEKVEEAVVKMQGFEWSYTSRSKVADALQSVSIELALLPLALIGVANIYSGKVEVGTFATMIAYWRILTMPIDFIAYVASHFNNSLIDAERLLVLLSRKPTITNAPGARPLAVTKGNVVFQDVNFAYDPRKSILKDVSFKDTTGKSIALVGQTGGGKSTILKLINRFYDVSHGSVQIDGQDVRDVTIESLREAIGVVQQDPCLFNSSIMDNLRYARLTATDEEIYEACRAAAIHEKILSFPDGYESKVGEKGVKLSGGEKQRVAIAQCILRSAQIILLDEATSAVDTDTEEQIQHALKTLCEGRTTFIIAHRLSTIIKSDRIMVIHEGEIVEQGTHRELLNSSGRYKNLWQKQIAASRDDVDIVE